MFSRNSDAKALYPTGLYPSYVQAYNYLKKKYDSKKYDNPVIDTWLDTIAAFIKDVETPDTINTIENARRKTLETIKADLILYMTGGYSGGDGSSTLVYNTGLTNPSVSNPGLSTFSVSPQKLDNSDDLTQASKSITNSRPLIVPYATDKPVVLSEVQKEKINTAFEQYHTEMLQSIEVISSDNKILSNNNIRPPILGLLVKSLNASAEFKDADSPIQSHIWAIITWYLMHNKVKGINLKSYRDVINKICSDDDEFKPFIADLNKFIKHCV
jgi:hypothetical protein